MSSTSDSTHIIQVNNSPSLRARIVGTFIGRVTQLEKINLSNYLKHRNKLEHLAVSYVPRIRKVFHQREIIDCLAAEWMVPQGAHDDKVLYYLHGGGYVICSTNTHKRLIGAIAKKAIIKAFAINYRLTPEHSFPAAIEDAVKGYEFLLTKGFAPEKILIAGDSAGGGLAVATMLKLREKNIPMPAAAALIAPWTDLEGTGNSITVNARTEKLLDHDTILLWGKAYAGNQTQHPLASPIYADLSGLPPLLIQVSASEILLDDSVRLHNRALSHGVNSTLEIWNGLIHVWQVHTFLPEARKAIGNIVTFARQHLK